MCSVMILPVVADSAHVSIVMLTSPLWLLVGLDLHRFPSRFSLSSSARKLRFYLRRLPAHPQHRYCEKRLWVLYGAQASPLTSSGGQLKAGESCLSLVWTGNLSPIGRSGVSLALHFGCGTLLPAPFFYLLIINSTQLCFDQGNHGRLLGELCHTPQSRDGSPRGRGCS